MQKAICLYRPKSPLETDLPCIAFRDRNSPSKMRLRYLEVLKHQERLNGIKKGTNDNFRGCKILSQCT